METRNFYILVAVICIGITVFWLSAYNFARLGIDPVEHVKESFDIVEEDEEIVVTIKGSGVKEELELTLTELKSNKYLQVKDRTFHFINRVEREWDDVYSGVSLWSILEQENILNEPVSELTFTFIGADGYEPPFPIELSKAEAYKEQVIIAYEKDGGKIYEDGPVISVVDHDVIPDAYNSQFCVKNLEYVIIN